jgi:hypothetical protein
MQSLATSHPRQSFDGGGLALIWPTTKMLKLPSLFWTAVVLHFACVVPEEYQKTPMGEDFWLRYIQVLRKHLQEKDHDSWCRGGPAVYIKQAS